MKIRTDIVRMYKEIHGWVGIVSGLCLFIAFFAGAVTMFEGPVQRWASPPPTLAAPVSLERTPELVAKVLAAHPEARKGYDVVLNPGAEQPARVMWKPRRADDHGPAQTFYASLAPDGALQVVTQGPSPVAQFIDVLHQQVGLPFDHEIAMPIMGAIALLYAVAIVSGLIVLLPSFVKDLFALRYGKKNVKRMWLDVHNLLGVFSLPFHLIMALTSVVFAFHDQFYDLQGAAFGVEGRRPPAAHAKAPPPGPVLTPVQVVARMREQAPGFTPEILSYGKSPDGPSLRVAGADPRYTTRGPVNGFAGLDPYTGAIKTTDYMPGMQDGWSATVTSFFSLHFGSFGGQPIRWTYFLLGLAGAALFYTGNLLWVETRRRRERKAGAVEQTRATRILAALTVGAPLGCVAGIAVTLAAAKLLGQHATAANHSLIYYAVFLAFTAYAQIRGAARSGVELLAATAVALVSIPFASLVAGPRWYADGAMILVDITAVALSGGLALCWRASRERARSGPVDSVWSRPRSPEPALD